MNLEALYFRVIVELQGNIIDFVIPAGSESMARTIAEMAYPNYLVRTIRRVYG